MCCYRRGEPTTNFRVIVPFSGAKKWDFENPNKNGDHFFTPTTPGDDPPQNGGLDICFVCLPLLDE